MTGAQPSAASSSDRRVLQIGVATGALYAAAYATARAMSAASTGASVRGLVGLYIATIVALFVCYAAIVSRAASDDLRGRRASLLSIGFPILFCLALTLGRPHFSIDVFTYIAQGRQAIAGHNPYAEAPDTIYRTRAASDLRDEGWRGERVATPYGPLWTTFEMLAGRATRDVATEALLLKTTVTVFALGCAALVWLILDRIVPRRRLLGTLLYLWNPVVILEFAGEGHIDAAVIFFMLLSLYFWIRRDVSESVVAMVFGALVKIVAFMFLPLQLVYGWRTTRDRGRLLQALAIGAGASVVLAVVVHAPFWIGWATFDALRAHATPNLMSASTPSVLYAFLAHRTSEAASTRIVSIFMIGGFLICLAAISATVRDAATLARACGALAVCYLVLAPGYWPWYAATAVAALALTPGETAVWAILAVSFGSALTAPIDVLRVGGVIDWYREVVAATIVGVWFPAAFIGAIALRRASIEWRARSAAMAVLSAGRTHHVSAS